MAHRASLTVDPCGVGAQRFFESVSETSIRSYIADARYRYLVAEDDERIAGFIGIRDGTHLYHLFVSAGLQGRGLARALWEQARVAALSGEATDGFTVNSSLGAVAVYRCFGFRETGPSRQEAGVVFVPMRLVPEPGTEAASA